MTGNGPSTCCLKVDVDTHDGLRDGVPRLLDTFRQFGVKATFFLAFGPDNAGKAIWQVLRTKGFLRKMLRTGAPRLYGWRTILSGTLLPARMIAVKFPGLVKRIADEGHEVGVHGWDHRLWQDHLDRLSEEQITDQLVRAYDAFGRILGRPPPAVAAPGWCVTTESLRAQDGLGFGYASDLRGGSPGYPELHGYHSTTIQIPTTQPCLEELLAQGQTDPSRWPEAVLSPHGNPDVSVVPLHAEVEGGAHRPFLVDLLARLRESGTAVVTLGERAERVLSTSARPRTMSIGPVSIPGRAGRVTGSLAAYGARSAPPW